jgi:hypothetical protein
MDQTLLQSGIAIAALAALAAWIDRRMIPLWERSLTALEQSSILQSRTLDLLSKFCPPEAK